MADDFDFAVNTDLEASAPLVSGFGGYRCTLFNSDKGIVISAITVVCLAVTAVASALIAYKHEREGIGLLCTGIILGAFAYLCACTGKGSFRVITYTPPPPEPENSHELCNVKPARRP